MKKQDKQEIRLLMSVAKRCIVAATKIANGGQPAPQDVAELMAAWGTIAEVIAQPHAAGNKASTTAQLDMLHGFVGEAA
jgi:hypothetical protein